MHAFLPSSKSSAAHLRDRLVHRSTDARAGHPCSRDFAVIRFSSTLAGLRGSGVECRPGVRDRHRTTHTGPRRPCCARAQRARAQRASRRIRCAGKVRRHRGSAVTVADAAMGSAAPAPLWNRNWRPSGQAKVGSRVREWVDG